MTRRSVIRSLPIAAFAGAAGGAALGTFTSVVSADRVRPLREATIRYFGWKDAAKVQTEFPRESSRPPRRKAILTRIKQNAVIAVLIGAVGILALAPSLDASPKSGPAE